MKKHTYRVGQWLPQDQEFLTDWMNQLCDEVEKEKQSLLPPVQDLKDLIESDRHIFNLAQAMFDEIPLKYKNTPINTPQVRDYEHMLDLINAVLTRPMEFNTTGLVGFPINAILDWPMATAAGYVFFMNEKVNKKIKAILDYWGKYLQSEDSVSALNTSSTGWLCPLALESMSKAAYGDNFLELFDCKSDKIEEKYGFKSWDEFFTRTFKEGVRPVAEPGNNDVIANACESAPYRLEKNVPLKAKFWIKGQPYSLQDMMDNDELAQQFADGTVYQAFLSALSYHRWHSPVSGKIVKAYNVYGSYYSENYYEGFHSKDGKADPSAPNDSQAYITEVASRAIIFIEADNPKIGLMCFIAVGMAEVSSNEITVKEGQHVEKGGQLGMFHFGGSTHCLIFRKGVEIDWDLHGQTPSLDSENIPVHSKIGVVK